MSFQLLQSINNFSSLQRYSAQDDVAVRAGMKIIFCSVHDSRCTSTSNQREQSLSAYTFALIEKFYYGDIPQLG